MTDTNISAPSSATPRVGDQASRWTAGRVTAVVVGSLFVLMSLVLLGAGGTALWADRTQREAGYVKEKTDVVSGGTSVSAPKTQDFWVASSTGPGTRNLVWSPTKGTWTVVVMNADARPGVGARANLGARFPAAPWIALGLLAVGAVFLAGGALLIVGAVRKPK
jgi:hypothetical protein